MAMRRAWVSLAAAMVVVFGSPRWMGVNGRMAAADRAQDTPTFKARSDLVLLHVTVTDRRGRYVNGLAADAFHIFDNGARRPLQFFLPEDAPATVGLLIDNSQSMQPNTRQVLAAGEAFVRTSHPLDEVFALTFNDAVRPVLGPEAPFTSDPATLRNALATAITPRGRTALHNAIVAGLDYLDRGQHERKVLVLVSDGGDNASSVAFEEIVSRVESSNVVVYAVAIVDPVEGSDSNVKRLRTLAAATGGNVFAPRNPAQVEDSLARVAQDIRHSYVVAYQPVEDAAAPPRHRIKVEVTPSTSAQVIVRTRSAYRMDGENAGDHTP
jgi:Ca-activated chloride channel family protein